MHEIILGIRNCCLSLLTLIPMQAAARFILAIMSIASQQATLSHERCESTAKVRHGNNRTATAPQMY